MRNCTPSRLRISATTAAAFMDALPRVRSDDDRPDVGLRRRLDDRVDGIADEELHALALEDLRDHRGGLHGCPPSGLGRPDGSISSRLGRAWPVGYSRGMIHALVLSALLLAPAPAGADEALWALLRGGGQVIVLHAAEPLGAGPGGRAAATWSWSRTGPTSASGPASIPRRASWWC